MTAATKYGSPRKLPCGDRSARRTRFPWGEAGVLGEGMDTCSRGARRGMGPSTCTRVAEIMSGRAIAQQGLARTCKDRAHNGYTGGAGRVVVWRMSPYERRRGGNAPPGGLEAAPARVTPAPGKGALGTRWPRQSGTHQTQSWVTRGLHRGEGARQTPPRRGEGCASTAVSRAGGRPALRNGVQNRGQNRTREIRPSGIVEGLQETWPVGDELHAARAPDFYLDEHEALRAADRAREPLWTAVLSRSAADARKVGAMPWAPIAARTSALADPAQRDQAGRLQSTIRHQPRADRFRRRLDRAATSAAGPAHGRREPRQIDVIADVGLKRALDDAHRVR